jgi:bifunctional DNA-binding transcriptional regulator/antitoxin component of YhaV-PrlF toxin-antitoxin module
MNSIRTRVSAAGRLSLPAEFRKAVGLDRGGDVMVELDGNVIRIRTLAEVIVDAQTLTRKLLGDSPGTTVADFMAERRREAAKEEATDEK